MEQFPHGQHAEGEEGRSDPWYNLGQRRFQGEWEPQPAGKDTKEEDRVDHEHDEYHRSSKHADQTPSFVTRLYVWQAFANS